MKLKFSIGIIALFILAYALYVYAVTPTHGTPLIQETTGGTETNLTFVNQTGSGTKPLVFNYVSEYKKGGVFIENGSRWYNNSDCVAYYPFDQNNKSDFCRNADLFASAGNAANVKGLVHEGFDFENVAGDKLETDQDANFRFSGTFCAGAWIKKESDIINLGIISAVGNGVDGGWNLMTYGAESGQRYQWQVYTASENPTAIQSNIIPINEWHHIVGVFDKSELRVYLYQDGNITQNATISGIFMSSALPFGVGGNPQMAGFDGLIDEAFVSTNMTNCNSNKITKMYDGTKSGFGIINSTFYDGTVGNYAVNMTICDSEECGATNRATGSVPDTTSPITNVSFNISVTNIKINDILNITCNSSDEIGLSTSNITINFTTGKIFMNYSISGTSATISNATRITDSRNNVNNITCITTDTSGNIKQNSTLITIADTLGSISFGLNITEGRIKSVVNASGNCTDADADFSLGTISYNVSGNPQLNNSFSPALPSYSLFNFSQATEINLTRDNVINFTGSCNNTDGTKFQSSLLFTILNTPPSVSSIIKPAENTLYNEQPLQGFNISWNDLDSDAITTVSYWVNGTLNQTIAISNGNRGNTTFNASDGKYNLTASVYDGYNWSLNVSVLSFKIDTINPLTNLTTAIPNLTFLRIPTNYSINANDVNLEGHNVTCWEGDDIAGTMKYSSELTGITSSVNTFLLEVNTSWGDGRYTCTSNASDDHTSKIENNYTITKDIATLKLDFLTTESKSDIISIKLKSTDIGLLDFYAYKSSDETKYIYVFNFSNTTTNSDINHTYLIKYSSKDHKLIYRNQSKFESHFVTPYNWIDCNLRTNYSQLTSYDVKEAPVGSGGFETTIKTPETTLICESIGGKNRIGQRTQVEIDTGSPQFFSLNLSTTRLLGNNTFISASILNFTYNVSDKNNGSDGILAYVNNAKNITAGYISNITKNLSVTFADANYTMLLEINDSAGNKINGSYLLGFVVDTRAPTLVSALNRTDISNSTEITTATDARLTLHGLDDLYLDRGNFSENCTMTNRSWINHSINIVGNNSVYTNTLGSANFTAGQVCGWKFYVYDIAGNELDPVYTFEIGTPASTTSTTTTTDGSGGGGGSVGATRQCKEYSLIYKTCYYFNGIDRCLKGCPANQKCNAQFECEATNQTASTPLLQSPLNAVKSPILRLFDWIKGLLGLSLNNPKLSVFGGSTAITEDNPTPQPAKQSFENVKQKTALAFEQNKWLPYIIVVLVIAGFGVYVFGLWQTPLALLIGLGVYGYIIIFILLMVLYLFFKYF